MMRLLRRSCLLVALYLLTSTAPAYAECAWVLWQEISSFTTDRGHSSEYGISLSTSSEQECRREATEQLRAREIMLSQPGPNQKVPDVKIEGQYVKYTFPGGILTYRYLCLPDTVDPRGPRAK
jgi:hypothetical protein